MSKKRYPLSTLILCTTISSGTEWHV